MVPLTADSKVFLLSGSIAGTEVVQVLTDRRRALGALAGPERRVVVIYLALATLVVALSELASNTAVTALMVPLVLR